MYSGCSLMVKEKKYLTTGEAAAIFDVDPDTVLRWIKSGEIPAIRTPGGHYRLNKRVFLRKLNQNPIIKKQNEIQSAPTYCWEYYSHSGKINKSCKDCIVFKSRASNCYELCKLQNLKEHAKLFCTDSCRNCRYYRSRIPHAN